MTIATLTSKGQVTIPQSIREKWHLQSGDKIDFQEEDGEIHLVPLSQKAASAFGFLSSKIKNKQVPDIKSALRRAFREGRA